MSEEAPKEVAAEEPVPEQAPAEDVEVTETEEVKTSVQFKFFACPCLPFLAKKMAKEEPTKDEPAKEEAAAEGEPAAEPAPETAEMERE